MPESQTVKRAKQKLRRGQAPTTAAGEFVREEIRHVREGKHGARSTKQAIAIGLSKARRAGVPLPDEDGGKPTRTPRKRRPSKTRARAASRALRREPRRAATHRALSTHAHQAALRRGRAARSRAAKRAARTRRKQA